MDMCTPGCMQCGRAGCSCKSEVGLAGCPPWGLACRTLFKTYRSFTEQSSTVITPCQLSVLSGTWRSSPLNACTFFTRLCLPLCTASDDTERPIASMQDAKKLRHCWTPFVLPLSLVCPHQMCVQECSRPSGRRGTWHCPKVGGTGRRPGKQQRRVSGKSSIEENKESHVGGRGKSAAVWMHSWQ